MCKSTPSKETFLWPEADETEFLLFEFFNRQLEDPKGRSCSELGVLRNLAKLPIPVSICRKIIFDETWGESESKENRKQKLIEKLQIMSKLCK